jgi:hypothetical protein
VIKCVPGFLSSRQTDTPGTDFRRIAVLKHIQVWSQSTSINDPFIPLLIEGRAEKYIVLDRKMLEPWGLSSIGDTMHKAISVDFRRAFSEYELPLEFRHLPEECHLSWRVSEAHGKKGYPTHKEGSFPASGRSWST